jgi:NADPH:quinone reductase-like Zn-dependent oxidoreductase
MPSNTAAYIPGPRARLEVRDAPYARPRANEVVVRVRAVAVNPVDWMKQAVGDMMFGWIKYPFVLGSDIAGEVAEVGSAVTRFRVGERVLAMAVGSDPGRNSAAEGAFQTHAVVLAHVASPIPDTLSFEAAAAIPLGLSTAACGLFQKDFLALDPPAMPPRPNGKALLIWGGSTSVGSNAIQLAVAAGYEVVTTASPRNFAHVRALGAAQVFDYNSETVVADVTAALKGKTLAGALAIGSTSAAGCVDIVSRCEGERFVALASFPLSLDRLSASRDVRLQLLAMAPGLIAFNAGLFLKCATRGVRTRFIFGSSLMNNAVGPMIYETFLPRALAEGAFVAAPAPHVVGRGLGAVQTALDTLRKGVSASKIVVALDA